MGERAGFAKAFGAMPFSIKLNGMWLGQDPPPNELALQPGTQDTAWQVSRLPGCLSALAEKCAAEFPTFAVRDAGEDVWPFLRASMPPASTTARLTLAHLQLHEHGACEFVKNDDSESRLSKGSRGQATPDAEFPLWTHQLCPFLAENVA